MKWLLVIMSMQHLDGVTVTDERGFPMESKTACERALEVAKIAAGGGTIAAALCVQR